jgi:hypothetical protein
MEEKFCHDAFTKVGFSQWTRHFQNMLVGLIAYTMLQQQHSMIFVTKGQV